MFSHLCISQSLVVDLIQDDHAIGGFGLLPFDVHCVLRHPVGDGTRYVVCLVWGRHDTGIQTLLTNTIVFLYLSFFQF